MYICGGGAPLLIEKFKGLRVEGINNKKEITVQPFNHSTVKLRKHCAFTLAEMMVVMLILTICLAAFAPLMTKKKPLDVSGIWQYAANGSDIYYGLGARNSVMIGQKEKNDNDLDSRLVISNSATDQPHIAFKNGNTNLANLIVKGQAFILGGPYDNSNKFLIDTSRPNTGFGYKALFNAQGEGQNNTAIGYQALMSNLDQSGNTAVGHQALSSNGLDDIDVSAENNTAIGYLALLSNKTGAQNTAIGSGASQSNVSGGNNVAIGYQALFSNTAAGNVAVGASALNANTVGRYNTALGTRALQSNVGNYPNATVNAAFSGEANTAVGYEALKANKGDTYTSAATGSGNTAVGYKALTSNTSGNYNVALGSRALTSNTLGRYNVAIGYGALASNIGEGTSDNRGDSNVAIGHNALTNSSNGRFNTAVGYESLKNATTGVNNTAIGNGALESLTTGMLNTAIGVGACKNVTSGWYKTCIGRGSGPAADSNEAINSTKIIYLGDEDTTVYIPGRLLVDKDAFLSAVNGITRFGAGERGNNNTYRAYIWRDNSSDAMYLHTYNKAAISKYEDDVSRDTFLSSSDRRLKNIKGENKSGLEQIRALQVFDFTFKKDKAKTQHVGVMAQDLQKIFPKAVTKGEDGYLMIRQEDMFYAAINAIKQLDVLVRGLIGELKMAIMKINYHDEQIKQLQKENAELKARLEKLEAKL